MKRLRKRVMRIVSKLQVFFREKKGDFIALFQKITKGHSDRDMWSLDIYLSKIIHKNLLYFKKFHRHGYPNKMTPIGWENRLDNMIYTFKALSDFNFGEEVFYKSHGEYKMKKIKETNYYHVVTIKEPVIDTAGLDKHRKRVKKGFRLFFKHYHNLWD